MAGYNHQKRVREELIKAKVTSYGLLKHESWHLHKLIHQDEHIKAVVYGRRGVDSVMLVATDKRIIFFDKKPYLTDSDELPYDMVSGVDYGSSGIFSTVTLHTRVKDYRIKYASPASSRKFVEYIEKFRLESDDYSQKETGEKPAKKKSSSALLTSATQDFLKKHEVATLASVDKTGNIHGAVVYYYAPSNDSLYIATKANTQKTHNIIANKQVAITVYDKESLQTVQMQALAFLETDPDMKREIMREIIQPRIHGPEEKQPPISKIDGGLYTFIRIEPTNVKFYDYKFKEIKGYDND